MFYIKVYDILSYIQKEDIIKKIFVLFITFFVFNAYAFDVSLLKNSSCEREPHISDNDDEQGTYYEEPYVYNCIIRNSKTIEVYKNFTDIITDEYIFDYRNVPEELSKDNITAAMKTFFPTYSNEQFGKEFLYNKNLYPVYRIKLIINNEKSFIVEITRTSAIYKYYVEEFNNIISVRQEIYPG